MSHARHVVLNVNVLNLGIHTGSWQRSSEPPTAFADPNYYVRMARLAERGALDALFLADGPALRDHPALRPSQALEPSVILASVAAETEHLGVIGTLSSTFNDPVELAARLLSLDILSGGRFAWNVVTTYSPAAGGNFGLADYPDRSTRYRRAAEFVDVVLALWRDAGTGRGVDHRGEFFTVVGSLALGPSPQGHPLLVQAGGSPQGRDLAGRVADAVFSAELDLGAGIEHYRYVKDAAQAHGRGRADVKILPGLITTIGSSRAEAERRYDEQNALLPENHDLERLSQVLGEDLAALPLDEPVPDRLLGDVADPAKFAASLGFRESVVRLIESGGLTLRQAVREFSGAGHRVVVGSPVDVADTIERWFLAGAADGFNLMPDVFPDGLEVFVDEVVPILRARGLFRTHYAESTLRERFTGTATPTERRVLAGT
ncbi:NtaA/DmoA family FMN-dependent monooxygenase [Mycobacterium yunnanensis]|uniref:NtaA/DmoA family FMN-dependent monooxygenase n=1 Tax=Mycobacterium yunnanensis TaxID=368477 RepID=A0A9X2Z374_9MYCO|nr:NtaA/DmoA family FMN-dependent monooxygenase [Mycobacterium yunnanensis]MCV7421766.1 NtaA/DmoA family FMN-dependent monooxygenase [Mycobacterium yunnanensis]